MNLNRENESQFYKDFQNFEVKEIEPVFVDFNQSIKERKLKSTDFSFIENTINDLSSVYYITDMGSDHNKSFHWPSIIWTI